jgi:hypothetical protein
MPDSTQAVPLLRALRKSALSVRKEALGGEHVDVAESAFHLELVHLERDDRKREDAASAEGYFNEALTIYRIGFSSTWKARTPRFRTVVAGDLNTWSFDKRSEAERARERSRNPLETPEADAVGAFVRGARRARSSLSGSERPLARNVSRLRVAGGGPPRLDPGQRTPPHRAFHPSRARLQEARPRVSDHHAVTARVAVGA